jgi:hypothetical protein
MIRSDLRDRIRKKLGETTSAFWNDTEINDYINDGARDLAFRTKCIRGNTFVSTQDATANTVSAKDHEISFASIDPDIYAILEVYFHQTNEQWVKLIPTNRTELDIDFPGWKDSIGRTNPDTVPITYNFASEPGVPTHYYWDREEDLFGWWLPTSTAETNANNLRVYFMKQHVNLSGDSDEPQIPEPLQLAIIDYGIAQGLEDRGWQEKANDRWNKYFSRMKDYMMERCREQEDEDLIMKNYKNVSGRSRRI